MMKIMVMVNKWKICKVAACCRSAQQRCHDHKNYNSEINNWPLMTMIMTNSKKIMQLVTIIMLQWHQTQVIIIQLHRVSSNLLWWIHIVQMLHIWARSKTLNCFRNSSKKRIKPLQLLNQPVVVPLPPTWWVVKLLIWNQHSLPHPAFRILNNNRLYRSNSN